MVSSGEGAVWRNNLSREDYAGRQVSLRKRMVHLWAKSAQREGAPGQPLWDHTIDVCTQMNRYYSRWRHRWEGRDTVCIARVLAYASLLHDLGKVHRDFQAMLRPGGRRFENRHEMLSLACTGSLSTPAVICGATVVPVSTPRFP